MHVLLLPSWYGTTDLPVAGAFFRDQALALQRVGLRVGVAYVEPRSLRRFRLRALTESHFQVSETVESGILTLRQHGWNPLAQTLPGGLVWARMMSALVSRYVRLQGRPDIIHAHVALWGGYAALHASARDGTPFVVTEHSSQFRLRSFPPRLLARALNVFRGAAATMAVSESLRNAMSDYGAGSEILVVPNTIDPEFWTLPPRPRASGPFTFCAVGRLVPVKRFDILIRAFAARFRGNPDVRLVIGGDGAMRHDLESLARALGVHEQVSWRGALSREGVRQAMWEAHCFVLSSAVETFGAVLIEALAAGLPVIATRSGGPEDIVAPEVGVLLDPGDEQALAAAMVAVRDGPGYDPQVLRTYAVRRYGYEAVGAQLRGVYEEALNAL